MNKQRRKALADIQERIEKIKTDLEALREEEEEYLENMPEGIQESERGDAAQTAIDNMEYVEQSLDEALSSIEEAQA